MINDSVREELATKITVREVSSARVAEVIRSQTKSTQRGKPHVPKPVNEIKLSPSPKNISTKPSNTAEIVIKSTNRTLIDFQARKNDIPEWRLQLQNVVQQRRNNASSVGKHYVQGTANSPSGAVALSVEALTDLESLGIELPVAIADDNRIINALRRIETSRNKYLVEETIEPIIARKKNIVDTQSSELYSPIKKSKTLEQATPRSLSDFSSKPTLVPEQKVLTKSLYDTSELDPNFVEAKVSTSFGKLPAVKTEMENPIKKQPQKEIAEPPQEIEEPDLYDDFAPVSIRFNSGLFDIIIASFATLLLLAPFMLLGGSWFTVSGVLGFLVTFAIVMFIYLTTTIGIFGKSFGMHLFSLEMIDIGGEEYPTFHQAAVSSSVFLLSLAFGGIGFLTSFFDEESRAVHDLVSGTIIVREF